MSSFGKFDTKGFDDFVAQFESKVKGELIAYEVEDAMSTLATKAVESAKKKTPVDTGTLRRNWSVSGIKHAGNAFQVDIFNNVEYAPFIENGHRIVRGGKTVGYQPGVFLLKDTMDTINVLATRTIQPRFDKALRDIMGD